MRSSTTAGTRSLTEPPSRATSRTRLADRNEKVASGAVGLGPNAAQRVRSAERVDVARRQRGHRARY